jgi:hypothetical protein
MNSGLVLCLTLLTWSLVLPRPVDGAQITGRALTEDAMSTPHSDEMASKSDGTAVGAGDPTAPPPSLPGPSLPGPSLPGPSLPAQGLPLDPSGEKNRLTPTASKLSPRLNLLANLASTGSLPADVAGQDQLLGLATSGAGSLSRDDAGNPVVDVRVLDASEQTLAALAALPADVLSVSPEYATITLAIAPDRLNDLANLAAVQYVGEVIRPEGSSSGNTITGIP